MVAERQEGTLSCFSVISARPLSPMSLLLLPLQAGSGCCLGSWHRGGKTGRAVLFKNLNNPGWCGSVDCPLSHKPKGRWFDSRSGHMPGLWARPLAGGAREATDLAHQCFSPCLSPFLTLSLKINE